MSLPGIPGKREEHRIVERPPQLTPELLSLMLYDNRLERHRIADELATSHVQLGNFKNGDLAAGLWLLAFSHSLVQNEMGYNMLQFTAAMSKAIGGKLLDGILKQSIVTKTVETQGKKGWF